MSDRCPACPGKYKCVPFMGPCTSSYKFIGEAPGWEEERKGECFVGKTGKEVDNGYLPLAGLRRGNIRIGNAIGCLPDTSEHKLDLKKPAHRELLYTCAGHRLYPELQQYPASLIIPMGAFACHAIDPDINLELHHGMPLQTKWGWTFPMYHPAGGIHEPKKMLQIRTDWYRLRQYINGRLQLGFDEYAGLEDYAESITSSDVHRDLDGEADQPLACDTEFTRKRLAFCLSYTTRAGRGRLIRAENKLALAAFQEHLDIWEGDILWHNWMADYPITKQMGLRFPKHKIIDTMVRAFNLGNIPQGLKALAFRELGMEMMDFDDVVAPHSTRRVLAYYGDAAREDWPKPEPVRERQKDGSWKDKQPHSMKTKLKTFFTKYEKDPSINIFEQWTKNWVDSHQMIEKRMGEWPGKCITHAAEDDWEKVKHYACRDADALRRLRDVLMHMESRIRKGLQETWREVAA